MANDAHGLSIAGLLTATTLIGLLAFLAHPLPPNTDLGSVDVAPSDGYVGSSACFSCHPGEHSSWKKSFHSTMTRPTRALFDGSARHPAPTFPVTLELDGASWTLERLGDEVKVTGPDLHAYGAALARARRQGSAPADSRREAARLLRQLPLVERNVVLMTGSHHYLAFWVAHGDERELRQLPFVYRLRERHWIPRREAFLQPEGALDHVGRFNANCIQCHTVAGRPGQSEGTDEATGKFWERYDSRVADLGISCEACHGPAKNHIRLFSSPWLRHRARNDDRALGSTGADESLGSNRPTNAALEAAALFVPTKEKPEASTAVCAQCHSYFIPSSSDEWWEVGFSSGFVPGDSQDPGRLLLTREVLEAGSASPDSVRFSAPVRSIYWSNGSIMVGGREANGLLDSPCAASDGTRPALTCVHCHSMHEGDPDGQLTPGLADSNLQCAQCHDTSPAHSGHEPSSSGSRCVACHMPATSYALLSGIVSHKIIVPPRVSLQRPERNTVESNTTRLTPAPHPCMLCHTDRSREWIRLARDQLWATGDVRSSAPPQPDIQHPVRDTTEANRAPWAVKRALTDNAAVRAVVLWAMASPEALTTGGVAPFDAVVERLKYDDVEAMVHIARRAEERRDNWILESSRAGLPAETTSNLDLNPRRLDAWFQGRDRSPITISE